MIYTCKNQSHDVNYVSCSGGQETLDAFSITYLEKKAFRVEENLPVNQDLRRTAVYCFIYYMYYQTLDSPMVYRLR